jgi:hypothetical protein
MVGRGEVRDFSDLATLGYVTRARVTQIMTTLRRALFGRDLPYRDARANPQSEGRRILTGSGNPFAFFFTQACSPTFSWRRQK